MTLRRRHTTRFVAASQMLTLDLLISVKRRAQNVHEPLRSHDSQRRHLKQDFADVLTTECFCILTRRRPGTPRFTPALSKAALGRTAIQVMVSRAPVASPGSHLALTAILKAWWNKKACLRIRLLQFCLKESLSLKTECDQE